MCLAVVLASCSPAKPPVLRDDAKVVLYAEFMHEVNSFSPILTTERDFKAMALRYGAEVAAAAPEEKTQLGGFLKAVAESGGGAVKAVPILQAKSMSGGPVDRAFYEKIKAGILDAVKTQNRVDGIYLSLHGAMGVEGMFDPEGDILAALRAQLGPEVPIAVSFDLHANVTKRRAESADIIVGYRTNPHRDHFDTGRRTGDLLVRTVLGEIKPVMRVNKMALLKGGGINVDFLPPFRKIFSAMKSMEKKSGALSVSFFPVHLWIDEPELGYSTVAITDGDPELASALADEIAEMAWAVRDVPQPAVAAPEEAVRIARKAKLARALGTVGFCDASDAVSAGAPGESIWILKALMEQGSGLVSYLTMRDEAAAVKSMGARRRGRGDPERRGQDRYAVQPALGVFRHRPLEKRNLLRKDRDRTPGRHPPGRVRASNSLEKAEGLSESGTVALEGRTSWS
ncbi:MAG: M81 family metallopeptidase [Candidatus Moduliflexus flocculans]|nr:M81 family metallopeptidase [Candidatus Moduliflexus flocculans]